MKFMVNLNKYANHSMEHKKNDEYWMRRAIELAHRAAAQNEVPVGAVVVWNGKVAGEGWNQPLANHDPCSHAEIMALRAAGQYLKNYRLLNTVIYVTLEPCPMCIGALLHGRVARLVFGAYDPKAGAAGSVFGLLQHPAHNHKPICCGGVLAEECGVLLKDFFVKKRLEK